ncbi:MAG TPA: enoyl-CoA hydratase [Myxococcota bacterium]|nr:enoyl-CoA hydratase [Myxococcota bacterium]
MSERRRIATGTPFLLAEVDEGVGTVTINRPERRNAMNLEMVRALEHVLRDFETAPDVRCLVLRGAGDAFCAGGDLKEIRPGASLAGAEELGLDQWLRVAQQLQRNTLGRIYEMAKPVVASVAGAAAGSGMAYALCCDLRIAADDAFFTTAFARVGLCGDSGGSYFLTEIVGAARARELYFLSERIDAKTAERLGIVNQVVARAELESHTAEVARRLARGPTIAYGYMKENIRRAASGADFYECLDIELVHHTRTGLTEDFEEATKAFLEKREPAFRGR